VSPLMRIYILNSTLKIEIKAGFGNSWKSLLISSWPHDTLIICKAHLLLFEGQNVICRCLCPTWITF